MRENELKKKLKLLVFFFNYANLNVYQLQLMDIINIFITIVIIINIIFMDSTCVINFTVLKFVSNMFFNNIFIISFYILYTFCYFVRKKFIFDCCCLMYAWGSQKYVGLGQTMQFLKMKVEICYFKKKKRTNPLSLFCHAFTSFHFII